MEQGSSSISAFRLLLSLQSHTQLSNLATCHLLPHSGRHGSSASHLHSAGDFRFFPAASFDGLGCHSRLLSREPELPEVQPPFLSLLSAPSALGAGTVLFVLVSSGKSCVDCSGFREFGANLEASGHTAIAIYSLSRTISLDPLHSPNTGVTDTCSASMPSFYVGAGGLNLGSCALEAGAFLTELVFQLLLNFLLTFLSI